jgi:hypothetical protein
MGHVEQLGRGQQVVVLRQPSSVLQPRLSWTLYQLPRSARFRLMTAVRLPILIL